MSSLSYLLLDKVFSINLWEKNKRKIQWWKAKFGVAKVLSFLGGFATVRAYCKSFVKWDKTWWRTVTLQFGFCCSLWLPWEKEVACVLSCTSGCSGGGTSRSQGSLLTCQPPREAASSSGIASLPREQLPRALSFLNESYFESRRLSTQCFCLHPQN